MNGIIKNNPKGVRRGKREQKTKGTNRKQIAKLKVKSWGKKVYHTNINKKKVGLAKLISDDLHFRAKNISEKRSFHNAKVFNSSRQYNNTKCSCT